MSSLFKELARYTMDPEGRIRFLQPVGVSGQLAPFEPTPKEVLRWIAPGRALFGWKTGDECAWCDADDARTEEFARSLARSGGKVTSTADGVCIEAGSEGALVAGSAWNQTEVKRLCEEAVAPSPRSGWVHQSAICGARAGPATIKECDERGRIRPEVLEFMGAQGLAHCAECGGKGWHRVESMTPECKTCESRHCAMHGGWDEATGQCLHCVQFAPAAPGYLAALARKAEQDPMQTAVVQLVAMAMAYKVLRSRGETHAEIQAKVGALEAAIRAQSPEVAIGEVNVPLEALAVWLTGEAPQ